MTMDEPIIPWQMFAGLVTSARMMKLPVGEFAKNLEHSLHAQGEFITISQFVELVQELIDCLPVRTLYPLIMEMGVEGAFAQISSIALFEKTARDALLSVFDTGFPKAFGVSIELSETAESDIISVNVGGEQDSAEHYFFTQIVLGMILRLGRVVLQIDDESIVLVELDHDPGPGLIKDYLEYVMDPVLNQSAADKLMGFAVDQPETRLVLPKGLLDEPLDGAQPELVEDAKAVVVQRVRDLPDFSRRGEMEVRAAVKAIMQSGPPTIEAVAKELATSVRSLQRKLGKENLSFKDVRLAVLIDEAKQYLVASSLGIEQIADRLYFSDRNTFSAAFKRVVGVSPAQFKKNQ